MRGEEERERKEQEKSGATISIGAVMIHLVPLPLLAVAPLLGRLSLLLPLSLPPSACVHTSDRPLACYHLLEYQRISGVK